MKKIAINTCYGGFSLSRKAAERLQELANVKIYGLDNLDYRDLDMFHTEIERDNPALIQVIEELGTEEASGSRARLKIVEIPDGIDWYVIDEYDGMEAVEESHQRWF